MKESVYKSYEDLPLFLNAKMAAQVLGVAPSSAYELMHIVVANCISLVPPFTAGLAHSVAPPLRNRPAPLGSVSAPPAAASRNSEQ